VEYGTQLALEPRDRAIMLQSTSQLNYKLLTGPTDLKPLRILATRELAWQDWHISIHVLGMSHAVSFAKGDRRVTELLTCSMVEPDRAPILALAGDRAGETCASIHGLVCRVRLQPISLAAGDHLEGTFSVTERLEVAFPDIGAGISPFTRIGWRVCGAALDIETVHSYPEEGRGVRSWSRFEAAEDLR
jgi:hypothetical protein